MATERVPVPYAADERTLLLAFLEDQRTTLRMLTEGLDATQLDTPHPPSDLTLGAMLRHLSYVEDWWVGVNLAGVASPAPFDDVDWSADPDWDWHSAAGLPAEVLREELERFIARSNDLIAAVGSLDDVGRRLHPVTGEGISLRWILLHLLEEYARHLGHADLIRESIDGATGL